MVRPDARDRGRNHISDGSACPHGAKGLSTLRDALFSSVGALQYIQYPGAKPQI